MCLVTQSCPTLCNPIDCSLPDSFAHGDSPGNKTGVGCHALLQGSFPTQGLNPDIPQCRQILYHLSHQGSPIKGRITVNLVNFPKITQLVFGRDPVESLPNSELFFYLLLSPDLCASSTFTSFYFWIIPSILPLQNWRTCCVLSPEHFFKQITEIEILSFNIIKT